MSGDSRYNGVQKGSAPVHCNVDAGTNRNRVKGDRFHATEGDYVSMGEKKKIEVFQKDVSMYAGANHDVFVKEKGKIETGSTMLVQTGSTATVNSASDALVKAATEITVDAGSKITLKVGGSSIVIESGSITIKSASIKFEQG
jgi:type VI secretion system secreted protein VgrG